jgi:hypothetical protein
MNWFTDKLYDLGASPKAGEAAWGELAAQDAMSPATRSSYYAGSEMPPDPRAQGWAPDAEKTFQAGIRATPWFAEFKQKFGEEPNLNDPDYDYRRAWAAGARPTVRDPGDNLLHWSSQFKGENHPNRFVNGIDTITGKPVGSAAAMPSDTAWMLPPHGPPTWEAAHRFGASGLTPPPARSSADAYRMGGMANMDEYRQAPATAWRDIDRAAIEDQYGGTDIHGIKLPPVSQSEPRAWFDALVPQTPAEIGLTVATGPAGRALGKVGRAVVGATGVMGELVDPAEAGVIGKTGGLLRGKPGGPWEGGIRVYHSSPHDFDRFDWSKLRTGEGANTYGAGFYAAENPAVSGQGGEYWKQFANRFGGHEGQAADFLARSGFDRQKALDSIRYEVERARSIPVDRMFTEEAKRSNLEMLLKQQRLLESGAPVGPRTYEVNIAARPELMLDWDKPLNKQTVPREQLAEVAYSRSRTSPDAMDMYRALQSDPYSPAGYGAERISGGDYYKALRNPFGREQTSVSEALRDAGIPGIRYLDQGSRNPVTPEAIANLQASIAKKEAAHQADPWLVDAEKNAWGARNLSALDEEKRQLEQMLRPTYNYVVTDPSKLDIMAKYGIAGGVPVGMGALAARDQYQR